MAPMHIVLVNQFYPPDVAPTGRVLHDVAETLIADGNDVTVLCSRHAYSGNRRYPRRQELDGVKIIRIAAPGSGQRSHFCRIVSTLCFYIGVFFRLLVLRPKPDFMLSLTTPAWIGVFIRCVSTLRRIPHAHWVMDIYPDVMAAHGMIRSSSLLYRLLQRLSGFQFTKAAFVLTLGHDMANRLRELTNAAHAELVICPLWADKELTANPPVDRSLSSTLTGNVNGDLTLLYSGNMGRAHSFDTFLTAATRLEATPDDNTNGIVRFIFGGDGARADDICHFIKKHPNAHVTLQPYVEQHMLRDHLLAADVLLISLDEAWQGMLIPSKVQAAFAVGKPMIFVGGDDNSIAWWIKESGSGWCITPGDTEGLLHAIDQSRNPKTRERMGHAAEEFSDTHFDRTTNCARICQLITARTDTARTSE